MCEACLLYTSDDITLQLRKGEVHALLGENGAGKSTLMSVLFGLYQPEEGKILKNGKDVYKRQFLLRFRVRVLRTSYMGPVPFW